MRTRLIKLAILAGFGLALAFALSCSGENYEGGNDNPGAEISSSGGILDSLSFAGVSSSRSSNSEIYSSSGAGESSSSYAPLDPPANVAWKVNSATSISLGWDPVSGASFYYIYRSKSLVGPYELVGVSSINKDSGLPDFTDSGLSGGTTYYYKVAACRDKGSVEGLQSDAVTIILAAPTGVTATANSTTVTIGWSPVAGAEGYRVYRSTAAYGTYELVGTATATSYENTGLTAGTTYYYKVTAYSSGGESPQSDAATIILAAPAGVAWQANSATSISLGWGAVSGATGYYIYRSENHNGTYERVGTSETTSYMDSGLSGGTAYYYKVAAYNIGGEGSQSSYVSVKTTYTVTYDAGSGLDVAVPANQTKIHNVALTLSTDVPTRTGWVFNGWNSGGTSYAPGASFTVNDNVTLHAIWSSVPSYSVAYYAGEGILDVAVPANQTKTHDVALTLSTDVPTRRCDVFNSWNTSPDGIRGTSYAPGASYIDNASVTLYAQWDRQPGIVNGPSVSYGGETYESVVICDQTWLKRNLNYAAEGSRCHNNREASCAALGRLYDWSTAMALPSDCNSSTCSSQIQQPHQGICPSGWHIPSGAEWETLTNFRTAATKLKATIGWADYDGHLGNGTDEFGFSALPGGYGRSDGSFIDVGYDGFWWSASEYSSDYAYFRRMFYDDEGVYYSNGDKSRLFSVRCVQD